MSAFDLILPLVAWGYHLDYARWLDLLDRAERTLPLLNPPELLRWNGDKAYLAELGDAGVPTVPTLAVEACCDADLEEARRRFGSDWLVIKPPVSASAMGAHRIGPNDDLPAESRRKPMIVQPLIEEIARTRRVLADAVRWRIQPRGGQASAVRRFSRSGISRGRDAAVRSSARRARSSSRRRRSLPLPRAATYARVDIVPDDEGTLRIMELELIEPALFLDHAPDGGAAFTRSILNALEKATA